MLDFGIAKLAHEPQGVKTATNALLGTPAYMSPEQCRGAGHTDHRSDIYSLGAILFEMVCGRVPFVGEGPGDIIIQHVTVAPPAPRSLVPALPESVERVILKALAKKAEDRYQTMAALARELDPTAVGRVPMDVIGASAGAMGGQDVRVSTTLSTAATQIGEVEGGRSPRSLGVMVAALAGGLVIFGGVAWWGLRAPGGAGEPPVERVGAVATVPSSAAAPPGAEPAAARVAAPASVKLRIDSLPPKAEVVRATDGVVVGRTPTVVEVVRTEGKVGFRLRLDGYRDEALELDGDHDGSGEVKLTPLARAKPPAPPATRPPTVTRPPAVTSPTVTRPPTVKRRGAEKPKKDTSDIADPFAP